ncbi:MAG: hypothetical protein ACI4MT_04900 [Christensenellales bacterium]
MKRYLNLVLIAAILISAVACLAACNSGETDEFALFKTDNFKDYATLDLNYEDFPTLDDEARWQGLYFVKGYKTATEAYKLAYTSDGVPREVPIEVAAEGDEFLEGENAFDPTKPSIIIIHGVQMGDGRQSNAYYWIENGIEDDYSDVGGDLSKFFYYAENNVYDKAWNVFYFHYEQFADAEGDGKDTAKMAAAVSKIVASCWTMSEDGKGSKIIEADYVDKSNPGDGKWSEEAAFNGSICEFFVAEYTRMMNSVTAKYPDYAANHEEIRFVAHSMGGVVTTSSVTLLTALADAGEMDVNLLPDRIALLDPYVGDYGNTDLNISWSGKPILNTRTAYVKGLKYYKKVKGGVVEFYVNSTNGFVPYTAGDNVNSLRYEKELQEICAYTVLYPYYRNVDPKTAAIGTGHNAIREWYFYSYTCNPISVYNKSDITLSGNILKINDGAKALNYCASAALPTAELKKIVGKPSIQLAKQPRNAAEYLAVVCAVESRQLHAFIPFDQFEEA